MNRKLLEKYLEKGLTQQEIAKIVGKAKSTIGYWITKYGLNDKSKYKKPKYKNPKMFNKIDTPEKAYIIGYALADGYINDNVVEFGCCLEDKKILQFIAEYIASGEISLTNDCLQKI